MTKNGHIFQAMQNRGFIIFLGTRLWEYLCVHLTISSDLSILATKMTNISSGQVLDIWHFLVKNTNHIYTIFLVVSPLYESGYLLPDNILLQEGVLIPQIFETVIFCLLFGGASVGSGLPISYWWLSFSSFASWKTGSFFFPLLQDAIFLLGSSSPSRSSVRALPLSSAQETPPSSAICPLP